MKSTPLSQINYLPLKSVEDLVSSWRAALSAIVDPSCTCMPRNSYSGLRCPFLGIFRSITHKYATLFAH